MAGTALAESGTLRGASHKKFSQLLAKVKFGEEMPVFGDLKFSRYACASSEKSAIISLVLKAISGCILVIDLKGTDEP